MFCIDQDTLQDQLKFKIIAITKSYLNIDLSNVNPEDKLDFNPLDLEFLVMIILVEFHIIIADEEFDKIKTISNIINIIIENKYPESLKLE